MPVKGLYVIINRKTQSTEALVSLCEQALQGGADLIQYRDKRPTKEETVHIARELSALCYSYQVPFVMNDHVHLASEVRVDGIHIGQDDIGVKEARRIVGDGLFIGLSASTPEEAQRAEREGADYIGCGHIYPTTSKKKSAHPIGLLGLQKVVQSVSIPVTAIGGITLETASSVSTTGATAIAVIAAIENHPDPAQACREFRAAMQCR